MSISKSLKKESLFVHISQVEKKTLKSIFKESIDENIKAQFN